MREVRERDKRERGEREREVCVRDKRERGKRGKRERGV